MNVIAICDEMSKYEDSFWSKLVWVRASVISYCYSNNCSKYEVIFWSKMLWVRASVISDKSSMRLKCPNSKSQFDPKWFELVLLSYLINLQWDDCYSNICDEMSKFEVSIYLKWFE